MDEQRMTKADMAREWIAKEIRIGNFARGSVLPPERELAVQIGVSYMTLRKAVSALVQEGILERNHGSGTFVCNEIPEQKVQKILGLVQPAWAAPETLDTVMYFSQACEEANWLLKVVNARSWEDRSLLDLWQNCDALALTMIQQAEKMPRILLEKLCSPAKPVVAVCSSAEHIGRDSVYYLNDARMEEPCDRLYELGHRRIFLVDQLVREYGILASIHPSLTGFGQVFRAKYPDVEYNSSMMSLEVPFFQLAHHAIRQAFNERKREIAGYSAVVCPLSFYWAVISGLRDIGFRVPEDMSVLTFGDRQEAEFYCPRPALFSAELKDQAYRALEPIRWRTQNPDEPPRAIQAAVRFSENETFAPARR